MRIRSLHFRNLRNHSATTIESANEVNIITGLNGHGKTTILEAISMCTLTRSFAGVDDRVVLRRGQREFDVRVEGLSDYGVGRRIEVSYSVIAGKRLILDGSAVGSAARLIGVAPTVALSPDMKAITAGSPAERRRFIDIVISQAHRRYLEDLMDYRRILKQRNKILADSARSGRRLDTAMLEPWDAGLIDRSARLMHQRAQFLMEFEPVLNRTVDTVAAGADAITLRYRPDAIGDVQPGIDEYRDALWLRSRKVASEEARRGVTMFGAHRDDVYMEVNGGDVRVSASQGQHKTLLIGLKIAEFHYLAGQCAERPVILLDDIFGELDPQRAERVYDLTRGLAQVFITAVSLHTLPFLRGRTFGDGEKHLCVENGTVASSQELLQEEDV